MEAGTRSRENWSNGRIVAMVFACLAGLIGLLFLVAELVAVGAHFFARDRSGALGLALPKADPLASLPQGPPGIHAACQPLATATPSAAQLELPSRRF